MAEIDGCDSLAAFSSSTFSANGVTVDNLADLAIDHGDTVTWTFTARPGCEDQTVALAPHRTASNVFDDTETQPLIADAAAVGVASDGSLNLAVPELFAADGPCGVQLDAVTRTPLDAVGPTSHYNASFYGEGARNDLVGATYTSTECAAEPTTTTAAPTTTTPAEELVTTTTATAQIAPTSTSTTFLATAMPTVVTAPPAVYYIDCAAARVAGVANIMVGSPGYRAELDHDSNGIACESQPGVPTLPTTGAETADIAATGLALAGVGLMATMVAATWRKRVFTRS